MKKKLSNNKKRKLIQLIDQATNATLASNFADSESLCQKILQLDPNNANAFNLLGITANKLQQNEAAEELFKRANQLDPKSIEAWNNLASLYLHQERFQESLICLIESLNINPKQISILTNQAVVLELLNDFQGALSIIKKAIKLAPKQANLHYRLGSLFEKTKQHAKAKDSLLQVLRFDPKHTLALHALATLYFNTGDFEQAEALARQAMSHSNFSSASFGLLSIMSRLKPKDAELAEKAYPELIDIDQKNLAFALARYFDEEQHHQQAFHYLDQANCLARKQISYDVNHDKATFELLKKIFSKKFIDSKKKLSCSDSNLIFIVGMPRSGTSLVEQIITSHPNVHGFGETDAMLMLFQSLCQDQQGSQQTENITKVTDEKWHESAQSHINFLKSNNSNAHYYTDKTTNNYILIGLIHILFPQARIIHCSRNPLDNCLSIYKQDFAGRLYKYAYNLDEMGKLYLLYQDLMQHWKKVLPSDVIYELKYETLVNNQQQETEKLLKHCQLTWHNDCLNFHKNKRSVHTASAVQVRQPIHNNSVEGWKHYEKQLQPLAKILGHGKI